MLHSSGQANNHYYICHAVQAVTFESLSTFFLFLPPRLVGIPRHYLRFKGETLCISLAYREDVRNSVSTPPKQDHQNIKYNVDKIIQYSYVETLST